MVYKLSRPLGIMFLTLWLSACSMLQHKTETTPLSSNVRQQQLVALQTFNVQASVGIKTPDDSISGNLHWQQQNNYYQARLSNFLGISLFELSHTQSGSEILLQGERYYASDTSSLLLQLAGWAMPLEEMPLWLRGLPGKNSRNITVDDVGRVTGFTLTDSTGIDWQLQYQSFFPDALALPKKMLLRSENSQIKLVIRSWQL